MRLDEHAPGVAGIFQHVGEYHLGDPSRQWVSQESFQRTPFGAPVSK